MAIKTVLETLDGVDDALKSLYVETDGKHVLQVEGVDAHPEVANLKSAYERVKADKAALSSKVSDLEANAVTLPEGFSLEKWEKVKDGKADEAALMSLRQEYEGKIVTLETSLEEERGKGLKAAIDRDLMGALTEAGITNATFARAARGMIAPSVKMADGQAIVETDMGPVPLAQYVPKWAAGEGKDFVASASGGGARPGSKGGGAKKFSEMSGQEKVSLNRENPQEYERLKAAG